MPRASLDLALAQLGLCQARLLELCSDLEAIADSLPSNINRRQCVDVANRICRVLVEAQEVEEQVLFPALEPLAATLKTIPGTLERLRFEHRGDICFAEELQDALLALGCGEPRVQAETAGYMLRGFFESVRRHVAFERELLAPLLGMSWTGQHASA